jgi:hypothetical protein
MMHLDVHCREWVSDCCLNAKQEIFSAIPWQEQVTFWWDEDDCFVLDQQELDFKFCWVNETTFCG